MVVFFIRYGTKESEAREVTFMQQENARREIFLCALTIIKCDVTAKQPLLRFNHVSRIEIH